VIAMTSRSGVRIWKAISAGLAASTLAGCGGDHKVRNTDPQPDETTRGIHVEHGRLGFDHALQVRRSKNAAPHELHDGDTVMSGDRIRVSIATSEDAYLYLAFCAGHELAVYPSKRGVRTRAGNLTLVPEGDGELVIDGDPGPEVLYLILSRTELSLADPHLADAIAATGHGAKEVDCGADLDAKLAKPASGGPPKAPGSSMEKNVLRGGIVLKMPMPASRARRGGGPLSPNNAQVARAGSGSSSGRPGPEPVGAGAAAPSLDDPDFARSPGEIVWYGDDGPNGPGEVVATDADGIAVVRYGFTHIAPTSPP
jgi:hypothetical protein